MVLLNVIPACFCQALRKSAYGYIRSKSHSSKFSFQLNEEIPEFYVHIREQNKLKSLQLKRKYDQLLSRALAGGGERGIDRHVKRNKKMLVRDRIKLLLDKDSNYLELSPLAGLDMEYGDVPGAGVVTLIGKVHGILCMIIGNDATVKSGSIYPITLKKQLRSQRIALENMLPCIYLVDSGGAFLPKQDEIFIEGGKSFFNQAIMSSEGIPQIAFVCGSCTAGGAYIPAMADEAIILHKTGTIFLGGPPLVYAATGERVTAEELGGATLHSTTSGVTDHFTNTEEEGLQRTRDIVATLNLQDIATFQSSYEEPLYDSKHFNELAPSKDFGYQLDAHFILACLLDGSRFHEFKGLYGSTLVTGFGYVKGRLAGFLVSNGILTGPACVKATHFIQLCAQRGIPIVFLQNFNRDSQLSGFDITENNSSLRTSLVKAHAQLMQASACANVPSISVATGGVVGSVESHALGSLAMGARFQFVYPNVLVGGQHPADLAQNAALDFQENSCETTDRSLIETQKQELFEKFSTETDAFYASSRLLNDGVILPTDTRNVVASCLEIFEHEIKFRSHLKKIKFNQPLIRM